MQNVDEIARQMAATGMLPVDRNAQGNNNNGQKSQFEQMLAMLAMSDKINPQTNLGFLLGQVLGGGLQSWAENYNARGRLKDKEKMGNKDWNMPDSQRTYDPANQNNGMMNAALANLLGSQQDNSALANATNREDEREQYVPYPFYQNPLGR